MVPRGKERLSVSLAVGKGDEREQGAVDACLLLSFSAQRSGSSSRFVVVESIVTKFSKQI